MYIIDRIAVVWMCPHGVWHAQALGGYGRVWEGMGCVGCATGRRWEKYVRGVMVCGRARAHIEPAEATACEESSAVA